jgi:hypothetical protein
MTQVAERLSCKSKELNSNRSNIITTTTTTKNKEGAKNKACGTQSTFQRRQYLNCTLKEKIPNLSDLRNEDSTIQCKRNTVYVQSQRHFRTCLFRELQIVQHYYYWELGIAMDITMTH